MDAIEDVLKQARDHSDLSRAELSRRTDTTRAALLEYEKGVRTPRADTFLRLLDATGTTITVTYPHGPRTPEQSSSVATLAAAVAYLDEDDASNWRLLISGFVANDFVPATKSDRTAMLAAAPSSATSTRWNTFVAALAEHLAFHAEIPTPTWVHTVEAHPSSFWWPVHGELPSQRAAALGWSPASFRRRGILIDGRELPVVMR